MEKECENFLDAAMKCNFFKIVKENPTEAINLLGKQMCPNKSKKIIDNKKKRLQRLWDKQQSVLEEAYSSKMLELNVVCYLYLFINSFLFQ